MLRQIIRTFIEVKNGVVRVVCTDPVYTLKGKEGCRDAKSSIKPRAEKEIQG